jgi:hypothetical protein
VSRDGCKRDICLIVFVVAEYLCAEVSEKLKIMPLEYGDQLEELCYNINK